MYGSPFDARYRKRRAFSGRITYWMQIVRIYDRQLLAVDKTKWVCASYTISIVIFMQVSTHRVLEKVDGAVIRVVQVNHE